MFNNIYNNKKVLITGHTGFKGTWLTSWLLKLGAEVYGISNEIPTDPSMFVEIGLEDRIEHIFCDVRDYDKLKELIINYEPDFVFHLAAQPIVSQSYDQPIKTISTNVIGTANLLDSMRYINHECVGVIITSDKCYENVEWEWGYKETDHLGGRDIYSASKAAAEVIFHAYSSSFFDGNKKIRLASARAGNVIGGGDWAKDRIVVDCMKYWAQGKSVEIRSPYATRPWQHVLEPLSGYLGLGSLLFENVKLHGESFNFGPKSELNRSVLQLLNDLSMYWGFDDLEDAFTIADKITFHEAGLLKLNCDKALFHLNWEANLFYAECVKLVSEWYHDYYKKNRNMFEVTNNQIEYFENCARKREIKWAK